jgi:3'(2'), 5'-bisphosphate nucleotidase
MKEFEAEHADAARLARAAGHYLMRLRAEAAAGEIDPATVGEVADRGSHQLLVERLHTLYPCDAVLSEEADDDRRRLDGERVWVIDPLDGTREFAELDRVDWAVHVALVVAHVPVAAAVGLPARHLLLSTSEPIPPPAPRDGRLRIVVSRTRPPRWAGELAAGLEADLLTMGSAGAKAMAVVRGEADVYVHEGGQNEWDSAAPVGVAVAAGFHASRLDGSPLAYNNPSPSVPDLAICRPELATTVLDALAAQKGIPH